MRRDRITARVEKLILRFGDYLDWYDEHVPFRRPDQLASHLRTINLRFQLGNVQAAASDPIFLQSLYRTLQCWGIGQRGSRLVAQSDFDRAITSSAREIGKLENVAIDDPSRDAIEVADQLWSAIDGLAIVENKAKLVPCSKALHHLLPDLVVPIDREYTRTFFGWHQPEFQGQARKDGQQTVFKAIFAEFTRIAQATDPRSYVNNERPWRTSPTKIVDNAIVGFCLAEHLQKPS